MSNEFCRNNVLAVASGMMPGLLLTILAFTAVARKFYPMSKYWAVPLWVFWWIGTAVAGHFHAGESGSFFAHSMLQVGTLLWAPVVLLASLVVLQVGRALRVKYILSCAPLISISLLTWPLLVIHFAPAFWAERACVGLRHSMIIGGFGVLALASLVWVFADHVEGLPVSRRFYVCAVLMTAIAIVGVWRMEPLVLVGAVLGLRFGIRTREGKAGLSK